jgi:hypothetical protein
VAIIAQYRFCGKDMGLLAIAFPRVRVLKGPLFYEFIPGKRVIVVSEDQNFAKYPDKQVIQIISSAPLALDSREGFLSFLAKQGVKASDHQVRVLLNETDDRQFWELAKIAAVLKGFPTIPLSARLENNSTVVKLLDKLFEDFAEVYQHYWQLRKARSTKSMLFCLMDMMTHARDPHRYSVRSRYRTILRKNQRYLPLFDIGLLELVESGMELDDWKMLSLLAFCSAHARPPLRFPYFDEYSLVGWTLKSLGYDGYPSDLENEFRRAFPNLFVGTHLYP